MNNSDISDGKISEVYGSTWKKKVLAYVSTDYKEILKTQNCSLETWLWQRENRSSIWDSKQRKSEGLRKESSENTNSRTKTKNYLGAQVCFYHLILLRV